MKKQLLIGLLIFTFYPGFAQLDSLIIESQNLNQSVKVFNTSTHPPLAPYRIRCGSKIDDV